MFVKIKIFHLIPPPQAPRPSPPNIFPCEDRGSGWVAEGHLPVFLNSVNNGKFHEIFLSRSQDQAGAN